MPAAAAAAVQRLSSGPGHLDLAVAPPAARTASVPSSPAPAPVQRSTAKAIGPSAAVHRITPEVAGPVPGVSPAPGASPAPGPLDRDLDDVARRLYPRLRAMLTAELRLDRERSGRVTDLRR
ncbi:MAG: hypothetical protein ACRDY2_12015 [Acidimicrobiales bacterium]